MEQYSVPKKEDEPDMERLIRQYGDSLLRMCCLYLHDLQLAEDAVQDTYIKVYRKWDTFKGKSSEKTWITSIAINVCKSRLRSSWYNMMLFRGEQEKEPFYEDKIKDDTILNEIAGLKPKYREVILLFYYQELKIKEIAAALRITESSATVRLSRAREQLRASLKGWYFDE
ncbi:RNA polymerase sigma factor [Sinanaerobacter sp. ZZT-01]|uniref:RNA polymerase sigma factor n=1 Tax=Sinanaerobacter sp. ZZT-01 TaxID=3111540 RepID=UPI002D774947|nr:sigma-70 family RNA polymerase sigma factor [Sinanaerobacter sp. ZZT-01]WRR94470.1 sigma-70 family RNA polymerase sigma factor [Sinanaerobacter sp. ZZT-01]